MGRCAEDYYIDIKKDEVLGLRSDEEVKRHVYNIRNKDYEYYIHNIKLVNVGYRLNPINSDLIERYGLLRRHHELLINYYNKEIDRLNSLKNKYIMDEKFIIKNINEHDYLTDHIAELLYEVDYNINKLRLCLKRVTRLYNIRD